MKINLPAGFSFSSASAAIKVSGRPDMAYAAIADGATAAAVFTRNRVVGAPVTVGRDHLQRTGGRVRALIVNSGNANCATGAAGVRACVQVCKEVAARLQVSPQEIFPSSTGIIGVPLPAGKLIGAVPQLLETTAADEESVRRFATAMMTTDTRPKIASLALPVGDRVIAVLGVAKGAGMIHPNLATMLVYIFSDVVAGSADLKRLLTAACDDTFNCISIDHDTSTNDTVLLLASGMSGVKLSAVRKPFAEALRAICASLAEQIVSDGEGVRHVARLHVDGARNRLEARQVARSISGSMLVKTALAGSDPNWGRILAAIGYSGVPIDPHKINIYLGPQQVCRHGAACAYDELAAHHYLSQPSYDIRIHLGRGKGAVRFLTTDLTGDYVHINADYST